MIISRTPYRISFFGGGTDYPAWYRTHGGSVLATSIDKYCYISVRYLPPFFEHKHRIIYSLMENVKSTQEIKHPAVKAVLEYLNVQEGLEIHHDGDLPARSGLGSSSAFTVGLLHALKALKGEFISKTELGLKAIHIEQDLIKETVGSQDQIAVAHGGFNRIDFKQDGTIDVNPLIIPTKLKQTIEDCILVFFTGIARFSSEVAKTKVDNLNNRVNELKAMGAMVDEAAHILQTASDGPGEESLSRMETAAQSIGKMLHQSWQLKRGLSKAVSNDLIDDLYTKAMEAGAWGGKVLGAGGGGFMMFMAPPERHTAIKKALESVLYVSVKFENTGSKIVVFDPQI